MKFKLNLKERLESYRRVVVIAKKPTSEDFSEVTRIVSIGLVIIGALGFVIYLISLLIGL